MSEEAADCIAVTANTYDPASPRAKFLIGCIKYGIAPRSNFLLRSKLSNELLLDHQGMGDRLGAFLAAGLDDLPSIQRLSIADNNLTDAGLKPLIDSIVLNPNITELDISQNKVDEEASESLGKYLGRSDCPLKVLIMRNADLDDGECEEMVSRLMNNRVLEVGTVCRNYAWLVMCD